MTIKFYEVGGAVRDRLLGLKSNDVDFTVIAPSYDAMVMNLAKRGFDIKVYKPEFVTVRALVPKDDPLAKRCKVADFVLARKDSATSDGRRPDFVEPGTLSDDLARRDFTVNALAIDAETDSVIDEHGGLQDLKTRTLRFVGDPEARIREDGLRVLRGFRFWITKDFVPDTATLQALESRVASEMLAKVSEERIREELVKMFETNSILAVQVIGGLPLHLRQAIFRGEVKLTCTMAHKK